VFGRLLWRSMLARRARVLLALLAVLLGVGVVTALATLSLQLGDDLARSLRAAGPNFVVLPEGALWKPETGDAESPRRAGLSLPETTVDVLQTTYWKNNILAAAPELDVAVRIADVPATVTGTWFDHGVRIENGTWRTGLVALRPLWRVAGRWPDEAGAGIALGRSLAARLRARVGDTRWVRSGGGARPVRVSGVVSAGGIDDERAWVALPLAQSLAGRPGECDRVLMSALVAAEPRMPAPDRARDPAGYEKFMCTAYPTNVAHEIQQHLHGAEVVPMTEAVAGEARVVARLNLLMLLLALAALTASTLGLLSTSMATVLERATELALMRALGASAMQITTLLLTETLIVSLAGGALGWGTGTAVAAAIRGDAFAAPAAAQPLLLPLALVLAALVALLGTFAPLRSALRMPPVEVLHG